MTEILWCFLNLSNVTQEHSLKWLVLAVSCRRHLTTALRLPESTQRVPGDKLILWNNNILESPTLPFRFSGTLSKILLISHSTGYNCPISNTNEKSCTARQRANSGSNSGDFTLWLSPQKVVCPCPWPQHRGAAELTCFGTSVFEVRVDALTLLCLLWNRAVCQHPRHASASFLPPALMVMP